MPCATGYVKVIARFYHNPFVALCALPGFQASLPKEALLTAALEEARKACLPEINVSPGQGKFLYLLANIVGARRILEIGTLGGHSTIWMARALPEDGQLVTLESESKYAEVASLNLARAGLSKKVKIIVGAALDTLPKVVDHGEPTFDLVFLDADEVNYCDYFPHIMRGGTACA